MQCTFQLFRLLLLYHNPVLCQRLDKLQFPPELYVTPWFLTIFARTVDLDTTLHVRPAPQTLADSRASAPWIDTSHTSCALDPALTHLAFLRVDSYGISTCWTQTPCYTSSSSWPSCGRTRRTCCGLGRTPCRRPCAA